MEKSHGAHCMLKLAKMLEAIPEEDNLHEAANNLARRIILYRDNGMAGLLIGDGAEHAITLDNRLNIIQLQNLKMPSPETPKQDYTRDEVLSVVIFGVVSAFIKKFALMKRPVPKGILVDESWAISASKEGRNMEEFISRMGSVPLYLHYLQWPFYEGTCLQKELKTQLHISLYSAPGTIGRKQPSIGLPGPGGDTRKHVGNSEPGGRTVPV